MKKYNYIQFFCFTLLTSFYACTLEEQNPTPTDERDKFIGVWTCAENSALNGKSTFIVDIKISSTEKSQLTIENFYNFGFNKTVYATVSGNSITLPSQTFSGTNTLSGNGTISADGKKIENMQYIVNDGSADDVCTAVLTKQ